MTNRARVEQLLAEQTLVEDLRGRLAHLMAEEHDEKTFRQACELEAAIRHLLESAELLRNMITQADLA